MSDILFPYDTLDAEVELDVGHPLLDGKKAAPAVRTGEERMYNLFEATPNWRRAEFQLSATTNPEALAAFEKEHGRADLVVVAHCRPTNARQTFRPKRSEVDAGRWEGTLELDRDNYRDRVELRAVLACEAGGIPHRPIGLAIPWTVHFDEPASLRLRGSLAVKWVRFKAEDAHPLARQFADSTHVVFLDGLLPEIWLNADFDGLEALLKDRKDRRGAEKGLHDMQRLSIARGVWMTLVADSMAAIRSGDDGEEPEWPEADWQAEVLRKVLPEVDPSKTERELLRVAAEDWRARPGSATFLPRAEAVVGDLIKANETLRRFVHTYREGSDQ